MTGLINAERAHDPTGRVGPTSLFVDGVRYANAAAKFWVSLVDEITEDFPECSSLRLAGRCPGPLGTEHLHPEVALTRGLEQYAAADFEEVMRGVMAELAILGPPSSVMLQLFRGEDELLSRPLPADCIDAELFPYIVVWLPQWAHLPAVRWNDEVVAGGFVGEDRPRGMLYGMRFELLNRHLSEGLYERSVSVEPAVSALA